MILHWFNNIWWASVGAIWMLEMVYMPRVAFAYLMAMTWTLVPLLGLMFALSLFIRVGEAVRGVISGGRLRRRRPVFNYTHKSVRGHIVRDRVNGDAP